MKLEIDYPILSTLLFLARLHYSAELWAIV